MQATKIIRVSEETYSDLAKRGTLSDTFDTVIQRLLKSRRGIQDEKSGGHTEKGFEPRSVQSSILTRTATESDSQP